MIMNHNYILIEKSFNVHGYDNIKLSFYDYREMYKCNNCFLVKNIYYKDSVALDFMYCDTGYDAVRSYDAGYDLRISCAERLIKNILQ